MTSPADHLSPLRRAARQLGPLAATVGVWLLFAVVNYSLHGRNTFATWSNLQSILLQTAVIGVAALGATMIIVSGGIDLSVGSLIALVSVVVAYLIAALGGGIGSNGGSLSPAVAASIAAAAGIAVAGVCGWGIGAAVVGRIGRAAAVVAGLAGGLVAWQAGGWHPVAALVLGAAIAAAGWLLDRWLDLRLPLLPFIVTLGTWGAFRGAAKGIANSKSIYPAPTWLNDLMRLPTSKADFSLLLHPWQWWSPGVWIFLALALAVAATLQLTRFGRYVYAIGSNEQTARLCGVPVERTKVQIYAAALLLAGVAGVLQFSQLTMGDPTTANGYELKVIASVVIGGASLAGGVGGVLGTVAGALLITIIDNGCTKAGVANWIQEIITGGIIVVAVTLDQLRRRGDA